jgi:hypothetical protein
MLSRVSVCVSVCALAALAAGASADNHGPGKFAKGEGEEGGASICAVCTTPVLAV